MHQISKKVIVGLQLTAATLKKALLLKYNQLSVLPSNKYNLKDLKLADSCLCAICFSKCASKTDLKQLRARIYQNGRNPFKITI